jgi:hypothetical protein
MLKPAGRVKPGKRLRISLSFTVPSRGSRADCQGHCDRGASVTDSAFPASLLRALGPRIVRGERDVSCLKVNVQPTQDFGQRSFEAGARKRDVVIRLLQLTRVVLINPLLH